MSELTIAGIADDSVVDGDGIRFTVFVQGCPRRCPHCQNPESQPFTGGTKTTTDDIERQIAANPLLTGITLSGGEPFCQPKPLAELADFSHKRGLDVWSYTGYTLEALTSKHDPAIDRLLAATDVLVDGEYLEEKRDLTLHFRGSSNQRVIDMNATRQTGNIVLLYTD